jgi:hypothetical protein
MNRNKTLIPSFSDYPNFLSEIRKRIREAQVRASFAVNKELISLYWDIGRLIYSVQKRIGWGQGVIPRLAKDIKNDFPEVRGFSERNIGRMKAFFIEYPFLPQTGAKTKGDITPKKILPQVGAEIAACVVQLPWRTNILLIDTL